MPTVGRLMGWRLAAGIQIVDFWSRNDQFSTGLPIKTTPKTTFSLFNQIQSVTLPSSSIRSTLTTSTYRTSIINCLRMHEAVSRLFVSGIVFFRRFIVLIQHFNEMAKFELPMLRSLPLSCKFYYDTYEFFLLWQM